MVELLLTTVERFGSPLAMLVAVCWYLIRRERQHRADMAQKDKTIEHHVKARLSDGKTYGENEAKNAQVNQQVTHRLLRLEEEKRKRR